MSSLHFQPPHRLAYKELNIHEYIELSEIEFHFFILMSPKLHSEMKIRLIWKNLEW